MSSSPFGSAPPPDPYQILDVAKNASAATIRQAYKKLALVYHPDKVTDTALKQERQAKFQELLDAYEVLSDEKKRRDYDYEAEYLQNVRESASRKERSKDEKRKMKAEKQAGRERAAQEDYFRKKAESDRAHREYAEKMAAYNASQAQAQAHAQAQAQAQAQAAAREQAAKLHAAQQAQAQARAAAQAQAHAQAQQTPPAHSIPHVHHIPPRRDSSNAAGPESSSPPKQAEDKMAAHLQAATSYQNKTKAKANLERVYSARKDRDREETKRRSSDRDAKTRDRDFLARDMDNIRLSSRESVLEQEPTRIPTQHKHSHSQPDMKNTTTSSSHKSSKSYDSGTSATAAAPAPSQSAPHAVPVQPRVQIPINPIPSTPEAKLSQSAQDYMESNSRRTSGGSRPTYVHQSSMPHIPSPCSSKTPTQPMPTPLSHGSRYYIPQASPRRRGSHGANDGHYGSLGLDSGYGGSPNLSRSPSGHPTTPTTEETAPPGFRKVVKTTVYYEPIGSEGVPAQGRRGSHESVYSRPARSTLGTSSSDIHRHSSGSRYNYSAEHRDSYGSSGSPRLRRHADYASGNHPTMPRHNTMPVGGDAWGSHSSLGRH